MEQPKVYNTEEDLIKWLKYDLKEQRKEIAKSKNIDIKEVKYKELVLNFGNNKIPIKENEKLLQGGNITKYINCFIRFDLILENILKHFNIEEQYIIIIEEENNFQYLICPFKVNISHCIFEATIIRFYGTIFEEIVSFVNTTFYNEVDFFALKFIKGVYFDRVNFDCGKNIVFNDVIFKNKVDFSDLHWKNKLLFYNINSNLEFNLSKLNIIDALEIIEFNKNKEDNFASIINLDNISFENSKSLLSIKDVTNTIESVSLKGIYMNGRINFYNIKIKNINLQGTNIIGDFSDINCEYDNLSNWQTARIFKHEEYKKSNTIKALEYHAEEIKLYKEELINKPNKTLKDFGDIFSIYLSSLYSDNGLNWVKSFLCTILFSILFFTMSYNISCIPIFTIAFISILYVLLYNKNILNHIFVSAIIYIIVSIVFSFIYFEGYNNIDYVIKELFSFIAPTNFSQILYDKEYLSYIYDCKSNIKIICFIEIVFKGILYFLGKIAFWYGSVQTVQAFRKFSKKE
ncbi:hypothetical protein EPJ79_08570 [Brachyspira aalborgi]|uniref:Uncharacterized protein n=1 Tax=Brachyspira aalborgi TaxID=29522 RepID=A0A5C8D889_9SPIR|nr:pentapeptide repeat-containing protein [Brachyspira aalborgi]TXJ21168.1 hypothetical protein EPJ79_08570 [Brachyspira aalborgi]